MAISSDENKKSKSYETSSLFKFIFVAFNYIMHIYPYEFINVSVLSTTDFYGEIKYISKYLYTTKIIVNA